MVKQWYYENVLICGSKKSKFIRKQEANGILSNVGLKTPLNKIIGWYLVLNAILLNSVPLNAIINMNEMVNTFLLARDTFMPEIHLKQSGFIYSSGGPFTENKERIEKFKETGDTKYIYRN